MPSLQRLRRSSITKRQSLAPADDSGLERKRRLRLLHNRLTSCVSCRRPSIPAVRAHLPSSSSYASRPDGSDVRLHVRASDCFMQTASSKEQRVPWSTTFISQIPRLLVEGLGSQWRDTSVWYGCTAWSSIVCVTSSTGAVVLPHPF